jgi:mevalonate kinase
MLVSTCSAPGKAILFGEHAVVHGVTAIAAALSDLRVFSSVTLTPGSSKLKLVFEDFSTDDISMPIVVPFDKIRSILPYNEVPLVAVKPSDVQKSSLHDLLANSNPHLSQGVITVVYLVGSILSDVIWGRNAMVQKEECDIEVNVKSHGLPIGAGLGSSAAFSVAVAGALVEIALTASGKLNVNVIDSSPWRTPDSDILPVINDWAYCAEILNHGVPSGLDNTTSCFGGLVKFKKSSDGQPTFEKVSQTPMMHILLTNTKVGRSTKALVASVKDLRDKVPNIVEPIFNAIELVSQRFLKLIESETYLEDCAKSLSEIASLVNINHNLLVSLGVSHSSLELIYSESNACGFSCKLTGAGGGGCAMTLLPWTEGRSLTASDSRDDDGLTIDEKKCLGLMAKLRYG